MGKTRGPASKQELRQFLLDEYETDIETVTADLDRFMDELLAIGALQKV